MARIINLDEIVPENVIIKYRDVEYPIPGDPPLEYVFGLWDAAQKAQESLPLAEQVEVMESVHARLLRVFQVADPSILHLPFGAQGLVAVSNVLFGMYGLVTDEPVEEEVDEENPGPARSTKRTSRRSSGSRS